MSDDDYVNELYSTMREEAEQELREGMQRAAQRCVKKAELKVGPHFPLWVTEIDWKNV